MSVYIHFPDCIHLLKFAGFCPRRGEEVTYQPDGKEQVVCVVERVCWNLTEERVDVWLVAK